MYPAFGDAIPIPSSLIHPRWFYDGPEYLTSTWTMSFDPALPAPNKGLLPHIQTTPALFLPLLMRVWKRYMRDMQEISIEIIKET